MHFGTAWERRRTRSPRLGSSSWAGRCGLSCVPHGASAGVAYLGFIDTELVRRAIDADPLSGRLQTLWPKPLQKRLSPRQAGEAIARGVEKRAPRIVAPKRWLPFSVLRGVINPLLDAYMVADDDTQSIVRELDGRGDQEQPLTA